MCFQENGFPVKGRGENGILFRGLRESERCFQEKGFSGKGRGDNGIFFRE
jgi:hypothetical protein